MDYDFIAKLMVGGVVIGAVLAIYWVIFWLIVAMVKK